MKTLIINSGRKCRQKARKLAVRNKSRVEVRSKRNQLMYSATFRITSNFDWNTLETSIGSVVECVLFHRNNKGCVRVEFDERECFDSRK